jgi:hypothetical protein
VGTKGQVDEGAGEGGGERSKQDGVGTIVEATGGKIANSCSLVYYRIEQKNCFCVT